MSTLPPKNFSEFSKESLTRSETAALERKIIAAARTDIGTFAAYVFSLKRIPFHTYMHDMVQLHRRISFDAPVEHAKTTLFSVLFPLFRLGQNHNELIALVSSTPELPRRSLGVIRRHIEGNDRLHRVFPDLKLVEDTNHSITVERSLSMSKDPSIAACGIEGAILGRRWTILVTDDMLRFSSTWTAHERDKIYKRFTSECESRLTLESQHIDIGTPWVRDDARHRLRRLPGYLFLRFDGWTGECFDLNGKLVRTFEGGLWPEVTTDPVTGIQFGWPKWRLEQKKRVMPGYEFDRQIRCVALSEAMEIFGGHMQACLELGRGIKMYEETRGKIRIAWREAEPSWKYVFTGVDLAVDKKDTASDTCLFTGTIDGRSKHLLEIRRGKMEGPEIVRHMIEIVQRYPDHRGFRVESNGMAKFLLQFIDEPGLLQAFGATDSEAARIEIFPQATVFNKNAEGIGVRAMSLDFERQRWPIPCDKDLVPCQLVGEWLDGLRGYDPVGHPDDSVIASWLFAEQCRTMGMGGTNWERFGISIPA